MTGAQSHCNDWGTKSSEGLEHKVIAKAPRHLETRNLMSRTSLLALDYTIVHPRGACGDLESKRCSFIENASPAEFEGYYVRGVARYARLLHTATLESPAAIRVLRDVSLIRMVRSFRWQRSQ